MRQKRVCPETEAFRFISSGRDKDIFYKRFINKEKGYGVFTCKNIEPGEFLLEYSGRHITGSEGEALFKKYSDANAAFLYFYSFQGKTCCVDGSRNTQLGRFINDDHINPNSRIKIVMDEKKNPHLCVFATTKINAGEEIVYDYGDPNCPWRHNIKAPSSDVHMEKKIRSERKNVSAEQQQAEENQGEDMHTDQLHSSHSSPQLPEKMDISQSDICVYPEMTDSHLSHIPEELCISKKTQSEQKNVPGEQPEQHQAEKNQGQDTYTDILCSSHISPQTTDEMDNLESILSIHPEMTGTHLRDSSSPTKEELTLDEMAEPENLNFMELSDEEQQAEVPIKVVNQRKAVSNTTEIMALNTHHSNPRYHNVEVKMSSNTPQQRIYDKKNYCLYCEKPYVKITRHLKQKHSDKVDVAKALAHSQGSTMRNLLLTKVRNMGNYHHNCTVLSSGKGQLVPKRQATGPSTAEDYLPCKFCVAMYVKKDLWRHQKHCKLQVKEVGILKRRKVQASSSLMLPMNVSISSGLKQLLEQMTYDAVTQVVKSDVLIISLGERMFLKNGEVGRYQADIRNKMRELARLVLEARKMDNDIIYLKDMINPKKFDTVLDAVKQMTGFDPSTNKFSTPSTALKLRHSLVKVSSILEGDAIRQEDTVLRERANHFNKLIEMDWTTHVSSNALKTLYQKKWNNPMVLPLTQDIRKLHHHLKCLEEVNKKALMDQPSKKSWSELSQITLTQLILFNRRREGEVSRMKVETYLHRNKRSMQDEVLASLSPFEKKLCENLIRVEVRGKHGRKVPVLFPTNVRESVELLIKTREDVEISPSNPYIFARLNYGSQENIRGCDSLKRYAESCGAEHPENITSTKLRKHVATMSQLLDLRVHELDQLANFLGHDINVHRVYYRLPEETLQMAKIGKFLFALEGGIGKFKGNCLEDIMPQSNSQEEYCDSNADFQSSVNMGHLEEAHSEEEASTSTKKICGTKKPSLPSVQNVHSGEEPPEEGAAISTNKMGGINKSSLQSIQKGKSRRPWSKTEGEIVESHFKDFLKEMKTPGKVHCQRCIDENMILRDNDRDWKAVKYYVYNKITAKKKQAPKVMKIILDILSINAWNQRTKYTDSIKKY